VQLIVDDICEEEKFRVLSATSHRSVVAGLWSVMAVCGASGSEDEVKSEPGSRMDQKQVACESTSEVMTGGKT
jgi:hypothetical protein